MSLVTDHPRSRIRRIDVAETIGAGRRPLLSIRRPGDAINDVSVIGHASQFPSFWPVQDFDRATFGRLPAGGEEHLPVG